MCGARPGYRRRLNVVFRVLARSRVKSATPKGPNTQGRGLAQRQVNEGRPELRLGGLEKYERARTIVVPQSTPRQTTPWCRACPSSCFVAAFPKKSPLQTFAHAASKLSFLAA